MKNIDTFKIYYDGSAFDIPKDNVKFENGYAVVSYEVNKHTGGWKWEGYDYTLKGVIDEEYDTVIDFKGWYRKIKIFPSGNVMVKIHISGGDGEQAYVRYENHHFKIEGKKSHVVKEFESWDYNRVNETIIQFKTDPTNSYSEALYDVVKGQYISERFSSIGNFDKIVENSEEKFALATKNIYYKSSDNVCKVICYIDENANIRSPLYCTHNNSQIDTSSQDFDFEETINKIKRQMDEDTPDVSIAKKTLLKRIVPKKTN